MSSKKREKPQWCYLKDARSVGFPKLVQGVKLIKKASMEKKKYVHLLHALSLSPYGPRNGSIKPLVDVAYDANSIYQKDWYDAVDSTEFSFENYMNTKIIYSQPRIDGEEETDCTSYIAFEQAAQSLEEDGSELNTFFANCLNDRKEPAGSPTPSES